MTTTYTFTEATAELIRRGVPAEDTNVLLCQVADAGLELDLPDDEDGALFTDGDLESAVQHLAEVEREQQAEAEYEAWLDRRMAEHEEALDAAEREGLIRY